MKNIQSTVIFIEQSKTDQESNGRWLKLSNETSNAINIWLDNSGINGGYIFRGIGRGNTLKANLSGGQVSRIYKRLASKAGFTKEFVKHVSGHSMRVGAAQDLLLSGASLPTIMAKGRWSKADTVMRYVEKICIKI
jgi:integrase